MSRIVQVVLVISCVATASHSGFIPRSDPVWAIRSINREPPPPPQQGPAPRIILNRKFSTKLDHFSDNDDSRWDMRYFSNNAYHVFGGPMFIFVGGEWPISYGWVVGGAMHDMAKDMNGYIFYTEHRYYGESRPTPDVSTDNLKYLTSDQAMEDLAQFIIEQKATVRGLANSKVILVGASYSASLVTWFSQAYPDLVDFAWASSAPLLAKMDFFEYKEAVGEAIRDVGGDSCYNRLQSAFTSMDEHIDNGNRQFVVEQFNLCNALSNTLDVWSFFSGLSNSISLMVQMHDGELIQMFCDTFVQIPLEDDVEALATLFNDGSTKCVDASYVGVRLAMGETEWTSAVVESGTRQWFYQTCNEFGWYQTSNSENQPFGSKFPVQLNIQMCMDFYNNQFQFGLMEEAMELTNLNKNGTEPDVQNVFFTHGEHDPWRVVGVQPEFNEISPVVVLTGYAHSQDLYSISDWDTPQMKETKQRISDLIRGVVGFL